MSNNLATYHGFGRDVNETPMGVAAFMGGKVGSNAVQFTIDSKFCCLTEEQVKDLIGRLNQRLALIPGFSATDSCEEVQVYPTGIEVMERKFVPFGKV